ncbi:hypothetical protein WA026_012917 [Henosepilachna vigintioctopunctata]|uniref:MADF domain-containing protein n=1 Tax=Henosepilachna vigintioctopunctata TaxID=420089 RepID=A0AAW1TS84_9CUCU
MSAPESDCVETSDVLQSFISMYEELPVLWNPSDSYYKNKRNAALLKLLSVYEKCKPGATISDVRRKINTLRCNYRKELKKIVGSKRSGSGALYVFFLNKKGVNNFSSLSNVMSFIRKQFL